MVGFTLSPQRRRAGGRQRVRTSPTPDPLDPTGQGGTTTPAAPPRTPTTTPAPAAPGYNNPGQAGDRIDTPGVQGGKDVKATQPKPPSSTGGYGSANPGTPTRGGAPVPTGGAERSIDDLIEDNVRRYLSDDGDDTAEESRLLAEQENGAMNKALVNQRASMGRAGFGASGALAGMENDARAAAARQLGLDQIGIREREQQQGFDRFQGATQTDIDKQRLAQEQSASDAQLAFLRSILDDGEGEEAPAASGAPDPLTGLTPDDERQGAINRSEVANSPDPSWSSVGGDARYDYYEGPRGVYHRVLKAEHQTPTNSRDVFLGQVSRGQSAPKIGG